MVRLKCHVRTNDGSWQKWKTEAKLDSRILSNFYLHSKIYDCFTFVCIQCTFMNCWSHRRLPHFLRRRFSNSFCDLISSWRIYGQRIQHFPCSICRDSKPDTIRAHILFPAKATFRLVNFPKIGKTPILPLDYRNLRCDCTTERFVLLCAVIREHLGVDWFAAVVSLISSKSFVRRRRSTLAWLGPDLRPASVSPPTIWYARRVPFWCTVGKSMVANSNCSPWLRHCRLLLPRMFRCHCETVRMQRTIDQRLFGTRARYARWQYPAGWLHYVSNSICKQ